MQLFFQLSHSLVMLLHVIIIFHRFCQQMSVKEKELLSEVLLLNVFINLDPGSCTSFVEQVNKSFEVSLQDRLSPAPRVDSSHKVHDERSGAVLKLACIAFVTFHHSRFYRPFAS